MLLAMHAPDGFLDPGVAVVTAIVSVAIIAAAVRRAPTELGDAHVPLAGISAAFIFAAQMCNFPVASGTTGHLLGGTLAAILLGPWSGALVVAIVVLVQALLFADGGLTALGYNVLNIAVVPAFGGWALFRAFRRLVPRDAGGVVAASALAALASVPLSAMAFSLEWLFGASAPVPFDTVFASVVGVHVLIGIGEAVLTAMVIAAVLASRPDLVAATRTESIAPLAKHPRVGARTFAISAVLVAAFLAMIVSQFAASDPDGLERVAEEQSLVDRRQEHSLADTIFADYATRGIDNEELSLAIAGVTGVLLTLVVGCGIVGSSPRGRTRSAS
jgi:cobalt/nickel transport system permease protein